MRVLIVDDDTTRSASLADFLVAQGIVGATDCAQVESLDEAKIALRAGYFDVLVLDVVLPKRRGEIPSSKLGLDLLGQLSRSDVLKRPEKIIGITSRKDEMGRFREEFERHCLAIVEAQRTSGQWREQLANTIKYTASSKLARTIGSRTICALSVHGIRTFGGWQTRLEALIKRTVPGVDCFSYRYGVFSAIAFFVPFVRAIEVVRLKRRMRTLLEGSEHDETVIFAHSFGTYLVAHAVRGLLREGVHVPLKTLVLAGSVLPRRFDWNFLRAIPGIRVVNDCGDTDHVLYVSEALVWGTGMAGKCGFAGFASSAFRNRFFTGNHSSFFHGDRFMEERWIPLFAADDEVGDIDLRTHSILRHEVFDKIVGALGVIKPLIYLSLIAWSSSKLW